MVVACISMDDLMSRVEYSIPLEKNRDKYSMKKRGPSYALLEPPLPTYIALERQKITDIYIEIATYKDKITTKLSMIGRYASLPEKHASAHLN